MQQSPDQLLFAHVVGRPDDQLDLAVAALMVGEFEYPDLDISHYVARLDEIGALVNERLTSDASPRERSRVLATVLFQELSFRGNTSDYYDPKNSFLNEVLERGLGIPITLAIVYIEIGRRVGLRAGGINFPGHFLVRVDLDSEGVGEPDFFVVDPFHGGLPVSLEEMRTRLKAVLGPSAELGGEHLRAAPKRAIIGRLLNNLAAIYRRSDDVARAVAVLERQTIIDPENLRLERELSALRERTTS